MESKEKITPHKITKPIQLLAAWLSGLVLVNASFLTAATQITNPSWLSAVLILASILNVPLFLISIFLLQTKFRPEMQEDSFYSKYLESKTGNSVREINIESVANLRQEFEQIERLVTGKVEGISNVIAKVSWSNVRIALNKNLLNFHDVANIFSQNNIPIHEFFGGKAPIPKPPFRVAIGSGFNLEQIKILIEALVKIKDGGWISFAHDDDEENQYDNVLLVGAYGAYEHGISFDKLITLINNKDLTVDEFYKKIGIHENPQSNP